MTSLNQPPQPLTSATAKEAWSGLSLPHKRLFMAIYTYAPQTSLSVYDINVIATRNFISVIAEATLALMWELVNCRFVIATKESFGVESFQINPEFLAIASMEPELFTNLES